MLSLTAEPQRGNISNMSKNTDMGQVVNGGFSF